jgi:metallo-beta-lactamase family protein
MSEEVKVQFLGAVRTVTGSKHMLTVNGRRLLLDCGFFQGRRRDTYERNRTFSFDPGEVDALILSHAHIDHSGNIPNLVKRGFRGSIYSTFATRDLCAAMLRDSAHIMQGDVNYLNKKRARRGEPPLEPLYTIADATACLGQFVTLGYERPLLILPNVRMTFFDAGHILGSALTVLEIEGDNGTTRLAFTGDLGRRDLPVLRDPVQIAPVDYLIIESTYGDRLHKTPFEAMERLRKVVLRAFRKGGKVIIPAFAVGRTQEIVYDLHQLALEQKIPRLPIFVDSPLATDVTEIFRLHPECYDKETHELLVEGKDPFGFRQLRYTRTTEESKSLNFLREPAVIISASGMCEAGRILHHLKNNIGDRRNIILFVGFQAENTLGRRLVDGNKQVRIFGQTTRVRAQIEVMNGYSAHADRQDLLDYVQPLVPQLRGAFVVHGELSSSEALADGFRELGVSNVLVPELGQEFVLD